MVELDAAETGDPAHLPVRPHDPIFAFVIAASGKRMVNRVFDTLAVFDVHCL